MRFITDGMLGKLTRWLRILGHDVEYLIDLNDNELIEVAIESSRILLTKDRGLYKRARTMGVNAFCVEGNTGAQRLAELSRRFNVMLTVDVTNSLCPTCNKRLLKATKKEVAYRVEKKTLAHYNFFLRCPECGRIYWIGAHWKRIYGTLFEATEILNKKRES